MTNPPNRQHANSIRIHRRRSGLSQREIAEILGYEDEDTVARHEWRRVLPPLEVAIAYEILFRVPVTALFYGLNRDIATEIEARLRKLEERLGERSALDPGAAVTARKLMWLLERHQGKPQQ